MAPAEIYAVLLDRGCYLCSASTMYRLLRKHDEVRERRRATDHAGRPVAVRVINRNIDTTVSAPGLAAARPEGPLSRTAVTLQPSTEPRQVAGRGTAMVVEVGYAQVWDLEACAPWRPMSAEEARERDAAGLPYVVVYREPGRKARWKSGWSPGRTTTSDCGSTTPKAAAPTVWTCGCWTTRRGCCTGTPSAGTTQARKWQSSTTRAHAREPSIEAPRPGAGSAGAGRAGSAG